MAGFIPELTTRIHVNIQSDINDAINLIESDSILSKSEGLKSLLREKQRKLDSLSKPTAKAVADLLQSNQEIIISTKHYITGMMANSVDITEDGEDYLVGNTAMSVTGFPYPLAINNGSKAHWVAPVTFEALHWIQDGEHRFSKGHMVSGITADPFVENSIIKTEADIKEIVDNIVKGGLK